MTSALFQPFQLRGLSLENRIMVSPMCQYSAVDGSMTDWHFAHLGMLSNSGAALLCFEMTDVEPVGRITGRGERSHGVLLALSALAISPLGYLATRWLGALAAGAAASLFHPL